MMVKSKASALFVLIALAFTHPLCAHSLVLCIGDGGHVELEASIDGDCSTDNADQESLRPSRASIGSTSETDHCGECVDIPMVHSIEDFYSANHMTRVIPPAVAITPVAIVWPSKPPRSAADVSSFRPSLTRDAILSVSLRI